MPRRVTPHQGKDLSPVVEVWIVPVHDLDLAEVDALETKVDIRRRQEIEP